MKFIVVGAGYAGAIAARFIAENFDEKVTLIEKRDHVAGNMFDYINNDGIIVHRYGPHISVMKNEKVFNYLSRFTEWIPYEHRVNALINNKEVPLPINFNSILKLYDNDTAKKLIGMLIEEYGANQLVPILMLKSHRNLALSSFGNDIYEKVFLHYTIKMWGKSPDEIDPAVTGRIPIRLSFDNRHFLHPYQVMPKRGFTSLFNNMLNHPNIEVRLNTDATKIIRIDLEKKCILLNEKEYRGIMVYTGALDTLFNYCYGQLPYRSLKFVFETFAQTDIQNTAVLNWPDRRPETRRTEMKKLTGQKCDGKTTTITEIPGAYDISSKDFSEPLYPIISEEYQKLYNKYRMLAEQIPCFYPIGRLADYKYYNMEDTVLRTLLFCEELRSKRT